MPMVVIKEGVKESSLNRSRQHDLPTPESPINNSLIYGCFVSLSISTGAQSVGYQKVVITRSCHLEVDRGRYEQKREWNLNIGAVV